jgi:hypothetical protein
MIVDFAQYTFLFLICNAALAQTEISPVKYDMLSKEARAILDQSEKFILISTDPTPLSREGKTTSKKTFHHRAILGQTEITDAKRKSELLSALYGAAYEYQGRLYGCFIPHHGIIAVAGTNRVELVICFECEQVEEFVNSNESRCLIHDTPQEIFNRTLTEAGVPLAKR